MADYTTWRTNAFENILPPPDGWPEHAPPRTVNNVAREMQSAMRRRADRSGLYPTSTGAANTYAVVLSDMPAQLLRGFRVGFTAHRSSSAGALSFQLNEFPPRALYGSDPAGANPRDIVAGRLYNLAYTGTDWSILNTSPANEETDIPIEFVPDVMTGVDVDSADGLSLSTAATGTDANTLYFRTTNGGEIYHGANRVESIALSGTTADIVRHGSSVVYARPQAVASLVAALPNTITGRITWTAPAVASQPVTYRLERALNSAFTTSPSTLATALTGLTHDNTGLATQTVYYYRVRAENYIGVGPYTVVALATSGVLPSVPRNVIGTALSATSIRVSWLAPSAGTTPISYRLDRATNSSFTGFTTLASAQSATLYTDSGLSADTTYYYRARATNVVGTSAYATSAGVSTTGTAPGAPTGFSATGGDNQVSLSWTAPSTGSTPITYRLARATNSSFTQGFTTLATSRTSTAYTDTGLSASTTYYYRVRAQNSTGNSSYTTTSATTDAPSGVAPGAIRSLSSAAQSASSINISWLFPSTGDTPFTYRVQRATNSSFTQSLSTRASAQSSTSFLDTGLSASTTYWYRVRAQNDTGNGSYTSTNATTDATAVAPGVPSSFSVSANSHTSVTASWSAPSTGDTPFTYRVVRASNSSFNSGVVILATAQSSTSYTNTGLSASTTYYYRVRATGPGGTGSYTSVKSVTTNAAPVAPGVPSSLSVSANSHTSVTASWSAPSTGDTPFTYRVVRANTSSFNTGVVVLATAQSSTSYTNTGLSASTTYWYRVRATNVAGTGSYTSGESVTTDAAPAAPSTVTSLSASATSTSAISVSWSAPSTGATPFTYRVQRASNSSFSSGLTTLASAQTGTSISSTGLSAETKYYYRVRATNSVGTGSYTSTNATTNATTPGTPTSPSATANSTSSITFTWSAGSGGTPSSYDVQYRQGSGSQIDAGSPTGTSFTVTGLTANTTYRFRVRAVNSSGNSSYTVGVNATTDAELTLSVSITAGNSGVSTETEPGVGAGNPDVTTWTWSGSFTASPSGGTTPYGYSWVESGDGTISGSSTSATVGITASDTSNSESNAPGDEDTTVTVTVTDAGSPQLTASASFDQEIDYSS